LEKAQAEADGIIQEARKKAGEILDQANQRGNQMIDQAREEAIVEHNRRVEAAENEIRQATNQAREALRARVAELAIVGATRVIEKEVDASKHQEILDKLAAEL